MTEDNESKELAQATRWLRNRLLRARDLRRAEVRRALGPLKSWTDDAAAALVAEGFAEQRPAPQGSWTLHLAGSPEPEPTPKAGQALPWAEGSTPQAQAWVEDQSQYRTCDQTGVVYQLAETLLKRCQRADGTTDYDKVFAENRAAVARLLELQRLETERAVRLALGRRSGRAASRV